MCKFNKMMHHDSNTRRRHVVKLEDPRPVTRHLIFTYCWNMDNNSSRWSMTAPFDAWFIAKHGDCRLRCTGNSSQNQLAMFRPSQCDSIDTGTSAWVLARVPATHSPVLCTLQLHTAAVLMPTEADIMCFDVGATSAILANILRTVTTYFLLITISFRWT